MLDHEGVGREQDFFELGGDSLAATEVLIRMDSALDVRVGIMAFARQPTVAGLARLASDLRASAAGEPGLPLVHRPEGTAPPASFAQERIWEHCRSPQGAAGYTLVESIGICGRLDHAVLRGCLEQLIERHPSLRTTFPLRGGRLMQMVHPPISLELPIRDISSTPDPRARAATLLRELAAEPFDLEHGPLLRLGLVRLGAEEHRLFRISHHITCDGNSWRMFMRELSLLYEARVCGVDKVLGQLPVDYGDIAAWERERLRPGSVGHSRLLDEWRTAPLRATAPPFARTVQADDARPQDGTIPWGLPSAVSGGLQRLGQKAGATYYMVRLALFAALLAEETGERDLMLGTYVTTRCRPEMLGVFGCFTQLAPLTLSIPAHATLGSWLATVRSAVLEVNEHAGLPYECLVEELATTGTELPSISTLFATKESELTRRFAGIELAPPENVLEHYMPSGFSFLVDRLDEEMGCLASFDARIYDPALVGVFIERYRLLAAACVGDLDRPLWGLMPARQSGLSR